MALRRAHVAGGAAFGASTYMLWGRGSVEVVGESYYSQAISSLFGHLPTAGAELEVRAHLVPEPQNRHDRNAVKVLVQGQHVGHLAAIDAARYQGRLIALAATGSVAAVPARVWARPEVEYEYDRRGTLVERLTGRLHARVTLALDEPHRILPLTPSPDGVQLPPGRSIKVRLGESSVAAAKPWLCPEGEGWVHATLHPYAEDGPRASRPVVEVRLDGILFGTLTPAMSAQLLPLLNLLEERGSIGVARALLRGNQVQAELALHVAKTAEVSADWLQENVYSLPLVNVAVPVAAVGPEPGWYEDPDGVAPLRFWDGAAWTSRIKMIRP